MKQILRLTLLLLFLGMTHLQAQNVITRWNFNSRPPDGSVGTGDSTPYIGNGSIRVVGGASRTFATGGGLDTVSADNSAYNTSSYPASGTGNKTAGMEARISTNGYKNLKITWSERHSNTSGNTTVLQYCSNVTASPAVWTDMATYRIIPDTNTGDKWYTRTADFTGITSLENNPNAGFRVVLAFDSATNNYRATRSTSTYGTTGTIRFDWLTLEGDTTTGGGGGGGGTVTYRNVNFSTAQISVPSSTSSTSLKVRFSAPSVNAGIARIHVRNASGVVYGTDYSTTPAVAQDSILLPYAVGDTALNIAISILNNNAPNQTDTVVFKLVSADSNTVIAPFESRLLIINNQSSTNVPLYTIAQIRGANANGGPDSLGTYCRIQGTVYGGNIRPAGLQFTVMDATGGMGVFKNTGTVNAYTVTQGDLVEVYGTVAVFRGLSQINVDSIKILGTNQPLVSPTVLGATDTLNEATESALVRINGLTITSGTWPAAGASANITVSNGQKSYLLRVLNATNIPGTAAPTGTFDLVGIGSQFSSTTAAPFVGGYQIQPRNTADIITSSTPANSTVTFVGTGASVPSSTATANVRLKITPAATASGILQVRVRNGAGVVYGTDYTTTPAVINDTLSIPVSVGDTSATIAVAIVNNNAPNQTDSITFKTVANTASLTLGTPSEFRLLITNNQSSTNVPLYTIAQIRGANANGGPDSVGVKCHIKGVVLGVNMRTAGLQFTLVDTTGGIGVFKATGTVNNYVVNEGDLLDVFGTVAVFRGLAQINVDSVKILGTSSVLPTPRVLGANDTLGEREESALIRLNNLTITSGTWPAAGASATITVSNGTRSYQLRILNATNIPGSTAPTGTFDVIGIGSQFSTGTAAPFRGGYQIQPRSTADILAQPATTLTSFSLLSPSSGANVNLSGNPATPFTATWATSAASNGGTVTYEFLLDDLSGNFTGVTASSVSTGTSPSLNLTYRQVDSLLVTRGIQPGQTANLRWTARATSGSANKLATTSFLINITRGILTGTSELMAENAVSIYPNPARETLWLATDLSETTDLRINLIDMSGRVQAQTRIPSASRGQYPIDIADLAAGVYAVRVENGKESRTLRLIVR